MTALSLPVKVRGDGRSGAINHVRQDVNGGWRWRFERLSLLTFFAAAKKVSAAPHRERTEFNRQIAQSLTQQDSAAIISGCFEPPENDPRL